MSRILLSVAAVVMTISPFCAQQETGTPAVATVPSQVLHAAGSVKPPKLIHQVDPSFSKEARKKKVSGNVEVYLIVDEQGFPQSVRVVRSVGYGLDEEAVKAVSQYRFAPATREGVPVKVDMYIDVNFQRF